MIAPAFRCNFRAPELKNPRVILVEMPEGSVKDLAVSAAGFSRPISYQTVRGEDKARGESAPRSVVSKKIGQCGQATSGDGSSNVPEIRNNDSSQVPKLHS